MHFFCRLLFLFLLLRLSQRLQGLVFEGPPLLPSNTGMEGGGADHEEGGHLVFFHRAVSLGWRRGTRKKGTKGEELPLAFNEMGDWGEGGDAPLEVDVDPTLLLVVRSSSRTSPRSSIRFLPHSHGGEKKCGVAAAPPTPKGLSSSHLRLFAHGTGGSATLFSLLRWYLLLFVSVPLFFSGRQKRLLCILASPRPLKRQRREGPLGKVGDERSF